MLTHQLQMNYVAVLIVAMFLFALIYWYAAGRYYYVGPRVKAQLIVGVEGEGKIGTSPGDSSEEKREPNIVS